MLKKNTTAQIIYVYRHGGSLEFLKSALKPFGECTTITKQMPRNILRSQSPKIIISESVIFHNQREVEQPASINRLDRPLIHFLDVITMSDVNNAQHAYIRVADYMVACDEHIIRAKIHSIISRLESMVLYDSDSGNAILEDAPSHSNENSPNVLCSSLHNKQQDLQACNAVDISEYDTIDDRCPGLLSNQTSIMFS